MTRTKRSATTLRRRLASVGLVGATAALTLLVPNTAEASTRVASPDVAAVAAQAIAALERWQVTASVVDYASYLDLRSRTASLTAEGMGIPTAALRDAWGAVRIEKQHVLLAAVSQLGVPYRSMRSEEGKAFDCSGLVLYAYREAGIELPRSSRDQIREADDIGGFDAEPGDLVYYPGHISLYVGAGLIVHSPNTGSEVEVRQSFDRSVRYGDVFDDSVTYVAPAPAVVAAARQAPAVTAGPS
jgi:NlpC/P60 family